MQERVQPLPIGRSPDWAGSLLGWGPAQIQPSWLKERQAARALHGRSQAAQERAQPLPTGRSPGRAGSPLSWCPAQIQPSWQKAWSGCKGVAWPKQCRGGPSLSLSCKSRVGQGAYPAQIQPAQPEEH